MRNEFSKRTKLDGWQRANGRCENCGIKLITGNVEYHHKTECTMAGDAALDNLQVLCRNCHSAITRSRAAVIAKSNRVRSRHIGIKKRPSFRGWRKFNGTVVYAERER